MDELNLNLDQWDPMSGRIYKNTVGANAFVTAATVAILATPYPKYTVDALKTAKVIGLIQDWNISQTRQSPQLFECGSNGKYTLSTGRIAGSVSISRVIYHGSNLLYLLYAGQSGITGVGYQASDLTDIAGYGTKLKGAETFSTGFAINLASSVFLNPLGLIFVMRTAVKNTAGKATVSQFFLEEAYIQNHGIGASAGAPYVGEQVGLTFEGIYPIKADFGDEAWPPQVAATG